LFAQGSEPDPRFSLANERTFLAWIRSALAFIAGGVALEALALDLKPHLRKAASLLLILTGVAAPVQAWIDWYRAEKSLRLSTLLPAPTLALPIAVAVVLVGCLLLAAVVLR
jgi:putative membrane protein